MILQGNTRLCQLTVMERTAIVVSFPIDETPSLWRENEHWQGVCSTVLEINNNSYLSKII